MIKLVGFCMLAAFAMASASASAAVVTVKCSGVYEGKTQTVTLKVREGGKIVPWSEKRMVLASQTSMFWIFSRDPETTGIEFSNSFRAPNGYAIYEVGTTADSMQIGVSLTAMRGFYNYRDIGSGSGNSRFSMTCHRL